MRRPRFRKPATEVSLFPFLAVLICTMGGLIVLLVMVVQQARVDARTIADSERRLREDDSSLRELQLRREEYEWRQQVLAEQRGKQTEEIGDRRLELGHLEEHLRELQARWKQLVGQADSLRSPLASDETAERQRARERELEQLRLAIDKARQELDQARRRLADEPKSYTIIPYQGPNGTRRRPIYLECTAQGVLVQPAGILLPLSDFQGPLGPGNPLDAVLRAIREHWRQGPEAGSEPYPLLLVRPDGVEAYAGARSALKAWDDEFGYELVEAQLRLKYPEEDRALAPLLQETIVAARRRQNLLAAAMPSRFEGGGASAGLVASSSGGFTRLSGTGSGSRGSGSGSGRPGRGVGASSSSGSGIGASGSSGAPDGSRVPGENTATGRWNGQGAGDSAATGDPVSGDPASRNPASGDSMQGGGSSENRPGGASGQGRDNRSAPGQTAQASTGRQAPAGRSAPGGDRRRMKRSCSARRMN
ncbi:MAG: hypothetical protein J5I93_21660 [Pirellulaceae bacterium]|nr:hypothetical protein [Pirellulaceae bacterium]